MNDCYSTGNGAQLGLRIETTASSFFAVSYHQLERVEFNSADGTDTVIVSFVSCTIRIIGKRLHLMANSIVKQEADLIRVTPKGSLPSSTDTQRREFRESARIDKIEVVEKENAV